MDRLGSAEVLAAFLALVAIWLIHVFVWWKTATTGGASSAPTPAAGKDQPGHTSLEAPTTRRDKKLGKGENPGAGAENRPARAGVFYRPATPRPWRTK